MSASQQKKSGRPKGSENRDYDYVVAQPTRCRQCNSTERTDYENTTTTAASGIDAAGQPYTHVVHRRTKCTACGQWRIDKSFENRDLNL